MNLWPQGNALNGVSRKAPTGNSDTGEISLVIEWHHPENQVRSIAR